MKFEEAFNMIKETNYEIENNIKVLNKEIILDTIDIKLVKVDKSTGEFGLCILYKNSIKMDNWSWWYPSSNQQKQLLLIGKLLLQIDSHNSKFWGKNNEN